MCSAVNGEWTSNNQVFVVKAFKTLVSLEKYNRIDKRTDISLVQQVIQKYLYILIIPQKARK